MTTAWTDNGYYHAPKSCHPGICAGCTSDESKHGKPIPTDRLVTVRRYKSRSTPEGETPEYHRVTRNTRTGQLHCTCKGWQHHRHCWHVTRVVEGGYRV